MRKLHQLMELKKQNAEESKALLERAWQLTASEYRDYIKRSEELREQAEVISVQIDYELGEAGRQRLLKTLKEYAAKKDLKVKWNEGEGK